MISNAPFMQSLRADKNAEIKWSESEEGVAYIVYSPPWLRHGLFFRICTNDHHAWVHTLSLATFMRRKHDQVRKDLGEWEFVPLARAMTYLVQEFPKLGVKKAHDLEWIARLAQKEALRQVIHFVYLIAFDEGKKVQSAPGSWKEAIPCLPN